MPKAHWECACVFRGMVDGSGQSQFRVPPSTSWLPLYVTKAGRITAYATQAANLSGSDGICLAMPYQLDPGFSMPGYLVYHHVEHCRHSLLIRQVPHQNAVMSVVCDPCPPHVNITVLNMGGETVWAKDYPIYNRICAREVRAEVKNSLILAGSASRNTQVNLVSGTLRLRGNSMIW